MRVFHTDHWASNRQCGNRQDGGFFSDLWRGFEAFGICSEEAQPYAARFDPDLAPAEGTLAEAAARRKLGLTIHWIKEWDVTTGIDDEQLTAIKSTLSSGWPVCGGFRWPRHEEWKDGVLQMRKPEEVFDGHSVLLIGFRDDPAQPGGGVFHFRNSGGNGKDGSMPYAYARLFLNDAMWIGLPANHQPAGTTELRRDARIEYLTEICRPTDWVITENFFGRRNRSTPVSTACHSPARDPRQY